MQTFTPPFKEARPSEIKRRLDAGERLRIVDVRERDEYQTAHVEQAELRPMSEIGPVSLAEARDVVAGREDPEDAALVVELVPHGCHIPLKGTG